METSTEADIERTLTSKIIVYEIKGRTFIVEPVFLKEGEETLGSVLMRLMKYEIAES